MFHVMHVRCSADALESPEEQMLKLETHDQMSMVLAGRVLPEHTLLSDVGVSTDTGAIILCTSCACTYEFLRACKPTSVHFLVLGIVLTMKC